MRWNARGLYLDPRRVVVIQKCGATKGKVLALIVDGPKRTEIWGPRVRVWKSFFVLFSISIDDDDGDDGGFPFLLNEHRGQLDSWKSDDRNLCPICCRVFFFCFLALKVLGEYLGRKEMLIYSSCTTLLSSDRDLRWMRDYRSMVIST